MTMHILLKPLGALVGEGSDFVVQTPNFYESPCSGEESEGNCSRLVSRNRCG